MSMWIAPPEYVVIRKLQYYREGTSEKHIRDIHGILHSSSGKLDEQVMNSWIDRLDLEKIWRLVQEG